MDAWFADSEAASQAGFQATGSGDAGDGPARRAHQQGVNRRRREVLCSDPCCSALQNSTCKEHGSRQQRQQQHQQRRINAKNKPHCYRATAWLGHTVTATRRRMAAGLQ